MKTAILIALFGIAFMVFAGVSSHPGGKGKHGGKWSHNGSHNHTFNHTGNCTHRRNHTQTGKRGHWGGKHGGNWHYTPINYNELAQNISNAFAAATGSPDAKAFDVLPGIVRLMLLRYIKFNVSSAVAAGNDLKWNSLDAETQAALKNQFVNMLTAVYHVDANSNQTCIDNVNSVGATLNQIDLGSDVNVAAINASFPMPPCKCQGFGGKGKGEGKAKAHGGQGGKGGKGGKGSGEHSGEHGGHHGEWAALAKDFEAIKKAGIQFELADTCPIQSAFWKLKGVGFACWKKH